MSLLLDPPAAAAAGNTLAHAPHHIEQLEHAVTVALSPLEYPDSASWGDAITRAICCLANATAGAVLLPCTSARWRAVNRDGGFATATESFVVHDEATERLCPSNGGDLVHWVRDDLASPDRPSPGARLGALGLRIRSGDHVAAICVHRDMSLGPAPQSLTSALRVLAPAFRTGVDAWINATTPNSTVARMLDSLSDAAMMFDVGGALLHANPSVEHLMRSGDTSRLREEAQCMAWKLGALARRRTSRGSAPRPECAAEAQAIRRVRIAGSVYELRASIVGEQLVGSTPAVLVTITAATVEPLTDEALHDHFGLTAREIQVARLVAEGLSNSEIADRLGVRFFTARNHVERTLSKLRVPSRNRVGPLLRNELAEDRAA